MQLRPDHERDLVHTVTVVAKNCCLDFGKIIIEADMNHGGVSNIKIKPEYQVPINNNRKVQ